MEMLVWLFPIMFMLHDMEEIIGFGIWLENNQDLVEHYPILSRLYTNFSHQGFAVAVLEEFVVSILISGLSLYFKNYLVWIGVFIAFSFHLIIHIFQSFIIRRYIPSLFTSILLLPLCIRVIKLALSYEHYSIFSFVLSLTCSTIVVILNLKFALWLMKKTTEHLLKKNEFR